MAATPFERSPPPPYYPTTTTHHPPQHPPQLSTATTTTYHQNNKDSVLLPRLHYILRSWHQNLLVNPPYKVLNLPYTINIKRILPFESKPNLQDADRPNLYSESICSPIAETNPSLNLSILLEEWVIVVRIQITPPLTTSSKTSIDVQKHSQQYCKKNLYGSEREKNASRAGA